MADLAGVWVGTGVVYRIRELILNTLGSLASSD